MSIKPPRLKPPRNKFLSADEKSLEKFININTEEKEIQEQAEHFEESKNDYFKYYHSSANPKVKRRESQVSLLDKSDEVNSNYYSINNSKLETDIGSPKGNSVMRQKQNDPQKLSLNSKLNLPSIGNRQNYSLNISKSNSYRHSRNSSTNLNFDLGFLEAFSVRYSKQQILEERSKLLKEMNEQLDTKLKKSLDSYRSLKESMSEVIKVKRESNLQLQLSSNQPPISMLDNANQTWNIQDKLLRQESVNSQLLSEGALLQGQSYFRKKNVKQNAEEYMKRGLERITDSEELSIIKKMENDRPLRIYLKEEALKSNKSERDLLVKKPDWFVGTNQNKQNLQQRQQSEEVKSKILTDWYLPNKYKGQIKKPITLEKQYPYINNPEYLYQNLYNIYDLYPSDPFKNNKLTDQSIKKKDKLTHLLNYKERLVHAPIIKELSKKLKDNNQRVPLIISDAFTKAEKKHDILQI